MAIVELILIIYFTYVAAYALIFSLAAYCYRTPQLAINYRYFRFCVLIPAFKEDAVILDSVQRLLEQVYPPDKLQVVVIADSLKSSTVNQLNNLPIRVIKVEFKQSTKVKSLRFALDILPENFDYAVILDADNVPADGFFEKVNDLLHTKNWQAVQCQREPKNKENKLAFLDGLSEAINNHIYRQGASAVNLSASISGSGIVVQYDLFKRNLLAMDSVGGFDRELELRLLRDGAKVHYYKDASVLDEKISSTSAFQNQRKRWISSQYVYLKKYFVEGTLALLKGNFSFFNSSILRNIQLPRLINLGLIFILTVVLLPIQKSLTLSYTWWPILFSCTLFSILIAIPRRFYSLELVRSAASVPSIFVRMLMLMFKLKGANKTFIHTPHTIKHAAHES